MAVTRSKFINLLKVERIYALKFLHEEGEAIPWWYGASYRCYLRKVTVCYPVPFHLIVRWTRDFWIWIRVVGYPGYASKLEAKHYMEGYHDCDADRANKWL